MITRNRLFTIKDGIVIVVILMVAVALYGVRERVINDTDKESRIYAEITCENETHIINLTENRTFSLPSVPHVIFRVNDHSIAFVQSNCPDQICVRAGFQSRFGHMAACLPNRLILRIRANGENDKDIDVSVQLGQP
ncbi:MAG: NusG domain II-containing protein [Defluviitaleaceae bacterium]|nr:NusG domain II-containing protein [Defluviitaleaceae bacterium]